MSIGSAIRTTAVNGLVKAAGLAGIGASVYDSHVMAKLKANQYSQQKEADRLCDSFHNTMYQEHPSAVMSGIKNIIFNFQMGNNFMQPVNSVIGYCKGFCSMLVTNAVPFMLGGLALLGKGKAIPRTSALMLVLYYGYQVLRDGFGFGRTNRLNAPYKN